MNYFCRTSFFLVAILCSLAPVALAVQIIYPGDKSIIVRADYIILKGGNQPPLDAMIVEINGVASEWRFRDHSAS